MSLTDRLRRRSWPAMLVLLSAWAPGCTSVLSTASLRDLVWDGGEPHAAEAASDDAAAAQTSIATTPSTDSADAADSSESLDTERREAAVNEAVERLAKLGSIDPATRTTLMATLDRTQPEDWPAVIEAFTESLPAAEPGPHAHTAAKAELDADAVAAVEVPEASPKPAPMTTATGDPTTAVDDPAQSPAPSLTAAVEPAPEPAASVADPVAPAPPGSTAPDASLAVENACFATRVQGWGVVDRFAADRFRPGQEVIVYFELAGLSASESPAGHTTCIDSTLRLVAADGTVLHTWGFEPIAESCRARRHDYFARYVVRLPETAAAGACRLELGVTDTLSGQVASAILPLELLQPLAAR